MCGSVAKMWRGAHSGEDEVGRGPDPPVTVLSSLSPWIFYLSSTQQGRRMLVHSLRCYNPIRPYRTCLPAVAQVWSR